MVVFIKLRQHYSQVDRLLKHISTKIRIQLMFGDKVYPAPGKLRQPFRQRQTLSKQIVAGCKIHQEIDIAVGAFLATHHRAEYANTLSAVLTSRRDDRIS